MVQVNTKLTVWLLLLCGDEHLAENVVDPYRAKEWVTVYDWCRVITQQTCDWIIHTYHSWNPEAKPAVFSEVPGKFSTYPLLTAGPYGDVLAIARAL